MHGNLAELKTHAIFTKPYVTFPDERTRHAAFAASIRMARAFLGWSQSDLAQMLGMTQRSIHRIEQGHAEPRRTTVLAVEVLLKGEGLVLEYRRDGGFSVIVPALALRKC